MTKRIYLISIPCFCLFFLYLTPKINQLFDSGHLIIAFFVLILSFNYNYFGASQSTITNIANNISNYTIITSKEKKQVPFMSNDESKKYLNELYSLMKTEKLYRNPNLTLDELAKKLLTTRHKLSLIINIFTEQNFYEFVNQYRINEICNNLSNPQKNNLTILEIAFDAGFNSKSSFNTAFKKNTNITPREYRNLYNKNNTNENYRC